MNEPDTVRRIHVVGTSASGKSTLARNLSARLGIPHVELDALNWGPDWTAAEPEELWRKAEAALSGEQWVVDGNYHTVRGLVWDRAEVVVWLDYSMPLVLWRLTLRTWHRVFGREELWSGNRETLRTLFSRHSLYLWVLQTHRRRRREYQALFRPSEYPHLRFVRLRSPRETEAWLNSLPTCRPVGAEQEA